jgi:uncharacterized membrane protein YdjX (TVP38/TMEM64 family)
MGEAGHDRARRRLGAFAVVLALLLLLAASWAWSPMKLWLDLDRAIHVLQQSAQTWGPIWGVVAVFTALVVAIPLTFVTVVALLAFGPLLGLGVSLLGACAAALVTFEIGKLMGHDAVVRLGGPHVDQVSRKLARRGILSVIAIRMVPAAPFAIVNMVVGTSHINRWQMLVGTAIGMLPGAAVMALFVDTIAASLQAPDRGPVWAVVAGAIVLVLTGTWVFRRWMLRNRHD